MVIIVYASEGDNVYDFFFLSHLAKDNVYLLTFNEKPHRVPQNIHFVRLHEPFHPTVSPLTGVNTYGNSFLRSVLLKEYLSRIRPDILIGSGALSYGFYAALSNYSPHILFVWGSDVLIAPKFFPFRFIAKYALKKADAVVVDCDAVENACILLGCDPDKIVKFPWVDLQSMISEAGKNADIEEKMRKQFRETMGWEGDDAVIISTRHHEPVYDVESLILAVPHVIKDVKKARFLILGSGSLTEKLKERVHELGVDDSVNFLGRVPHDDMSKYLEMSDVYVSTSLSDGTSASLLEAMACKLPPVATNIPANREWIENGISGLLVPRKNPKSLAENIVKILNDGDSRRSLAKKAHKTVIERADWEKNSKLLDNLIISMVRH